jgi:hypothetical protein
VGVALLRCRDRRPISSDTPEDRRLTSLPDILELSVVDLLILADGRRPWQVGYRSHA